MFKRNNQKGFISAELGIGILVISLLTILGFLAATDLDTEVQRGPLLTVNAPTYIVTLQEGLKMLQEAVNDGSYLTEFNKAPPNAYGNRACTVIPALGDMPKSWGYGSCNQLGYKVYNLSVGNGLEISPHIGSSYSDYISVMVTLENPICDELNKFIPKSWSNIVECNDHDSVKRTFKIRNGENIGIDPLNTVTEEKELIWGDWES